MRSITETDNLNFTRVGVVFAAHTVAYTLDVDVNEGAKF
jgi:hypothetical protein